MTHYSEISGRCRVDIFKPSGKWYMTVTIDMSEHYNALFTDLAVKECLENKIVSGTRTKGHNLDDGWYAVCLDPYHKHSHPIMLKG